MARSRPDQDTTGPSSEPRKPMVVLGPVAAPVARTVGQGIGAKEILDGFEVWKLYKFTPAQFTWSMVVLTAGLSWLTNYLEKRAGRRVIGTTA